MTTYAGSLDTNVLLRAILNDIPEQHTLAKELIENTKARYKVSDIAISEIIFVLERHYQVERDQIAEVITDLVGHPRLSCNINVIKRSAAVYKEHPSLSFEDCLLVEQARDANALPLWTFDKKLATQNNLAQLLGE